MRYTYCLPDGSYVGISEEIAERGGSVMDFTMVNGVVVPARLVGPDISPLEQIWRAYHVAVRADELYSEVIQRLFPKRTRWTLTPDENEHPLIAGAFRAKQQAFDCWERLARTRQ